MLRHTQSVNVYGSIANIYFSYAIPSSNSVPFFQLRMYAFIFPPPAVLALEYFFLGKISREFLIIIRSICIFKSCLIVKKFVRQ